MFFIYSKRDNSFYVLRFSEIPSRSSSAFGSTECVRVRLVVLGGNESFFSVEQNANANANGQHHYVWMNAKVDARMV